MTISKPTDKVIIENSTIKSHPFDEPVNIGAIEKLYPLNSSAKYKLYTNGFIVLKDYQQKNLSDCYWDLFNKTEVSVFVTSDAFLHLFHLIHEDLLKEIECQTLYNSTLDLVKKMKNTSISEYENASLLYPVVKEAARRNVVFFSVACCLLNNTTSVPAYAKQNVTDYVNRILDHNTTEFYPGDDWTQYKPRGHYDGNIMLEKYFMCIKWLGRHILRIWDNYYPDDSHLELVQAAMISQTLNNNTTDMALWEQVYRVTRILCGVADSITPPMVWNGITNVYGASFNMTMLESEVNIKKLRDEFNKTDYPVSQVIPVPTKYPGQIPPKYIQFMGERYLADSDVFQQTSFPNGRDMGILPKGLDVMATAGSSDRAYALLQNDMNVYPNLKSQLDMLKNRFDNYSLDNWTSSVYNNWLYALRPLLVKANASQPLFMRNIAWQNQKLNTALSSWTHLRHDYILYGKQTNMPGPMTNAPGYVEPIPEFYTILSSLCKKITSDLSDVISTNTKVSLNILEGQLNAYKGYSDKIVAGQQLTMIEQSDIHSFGLWLLGFFDRMFGHVEEKRPVVVADVCTDSITSDVLHEGVGNFNPIIVVYTEPNGTKMAGLGYVMSYYEFAEHNFTRISDSEWEYRVDTGNLPSRPEWTKSFLFPGDVPSIPTAVTLNPSTGITENSVTLSWTINTDKDFLKYEIYKSETKGYLGNTTGNITTQSTVTFNVTGLSPSATYHFTVRVYNVNYIYSDSNQVETTTRSVIGENNFVGLVGGIVVLVATVILLTRKRK